MRECISIHIGQAGIQTGEPKMKKIDKTKKNRAAVFVDVLQAGRFPNGSSWAAKPIHAGRKHGGPAHPTTQRA